MPCGDTLDRPRTEAVPGTQTSLHNRRVSVGTPLADGKIIGEPAGRSRTPDAKTQRPAMIEPHHVACDSPECLSCQTMPNWMTVDNRTWTEITRARSRSGAGDR